MEKQAFAFYMQHYVIKNPHLKELRSCLLLSKPSGYDLSRFFPREWRYKSYGDAQSQLPSICSDALLIKTAKRNADCQQLTFVQNFFRQSEAYQANPVHSQEFAEDLRKNLSISTLSNLLFVNFEIFVVKCGYMEGFAQAKEEEIAIESWLKAKDGFLDLEIVEASEKFLSPYEQDYIGFFVIPRGKATQNITLRLLQEEWKHLNEYHKKNYIFSSLYL